MVNRGNYTFGVLVLVLIATARYARITLASGGRELNVSEQANDKTDIFHNSTGRNGSSESCDTFTGTNSSKVGENITSDGRHECPHDKSLPPPRLPRKTHGVFAYVAMFLGLWSVVANSLPLAAIIKYEQLHTPAYILMANLAASDVLSGLAFMFGCGTALFHLYAETMPSIAMSRNYFTSMFFSGLCSAYSLMALTAERYWFIVHGMTYVNNVTNDKCKVVILIIWVWSALLAMLPIFGWHCLPYEEDCLPIGGGLPYSYVVVVLVFVFIPMATIILLNMGVLWCLWKHVNAIAAQEAAVGAQPSASRKSAITIVIITIVFLVGWLPLFVGLAMLTEDFLPLYRMLTFVILNSAINPVIYGFRLKEVRHSVARLFRRENAIIALN